MLSGGIDSAALAYLERPEVGVTIDYGQKPFNGELRAAKTIASILDMEHHTISANCAALGSGDLAGTPSLELAPESEWWPYRNQLLVTLAAMKCIGLGVNKLLVGSVKSDAFHSDGTDAFYQKLDSLLSFQEGGMRVIAPAVELTPLELIVRSRIPSSVLGWTHSCHKAEYACGVCRGCNKSFELLHAVFNG